MELNKTISKTIINILLADDDADDRYFFEKALKELPVEVNLTVLHDGEQLMDYLFKNVNNLPHILFLDLSMPRKTGFECLTEIKENVKLKWLPVAVFTTSFSRSIEFELGLASTLSSIGAEDYIRKPGDFEELKRIIHNVIIRVQKNGLLNDKDKIPKGSL